MPLTRFYPSYQYWTTGSLAESFPALRPESTILKDKKKSVLIWFVTRGVSFHCLCDVDVPGLWHLLAQFASRWCYFSTSLETTNGAVLYFSGIKHFNFILTICLFENCQFYLFSDQQNNIFLFWKFDFLSKIKISSFSTELPNLHLFLWLDHHAIWILIDITYTITPDGTTEEHE